MTRYLKDGIHKLEIQNTSMDDLFTVSFYELMGSTWVALGPAETWHVDALADAYGEVVE